MRRCDHGNYIPDWETSDKAPYCSGCKTPDPMVDLKTLAVLSIEWNRRLDQELRESDGTEA